MAKLADYIKIKHGFAFKGDFISTEDNNIVLVTPGNFAIGGGFKEEKCKYFTGNYPEDYVLKADDLIVTMTDLSKAVDTLGYSAIVPFSEKRLYLHNQRIGLVQFFNNEIDKHYLYWFMRTPKYQKTVAATSSGSTVHHTSPDRICEIEIEVPGKDIQKKVAALLDEIENKIKVNEKINRNLEEQANIFYEKWKEELSGELAELSTVIEVRDGTHDSPKAQDEGYPLVTSKHLKEYDVDLQTPNLISETDYIKINDRSKVDQYDVLMSMIGTIGLISFVSRSEINFAIKNVALFKTSKKKEFAYYFLMYLKSKETMQNIEKCLAGSTQKYISLGELRKLKISVPTDELLMQFNSIVEPMINKICINVEENRRLTELRDALLPKLLSGDLDVSDLEI